MSNSKKIDKFFLLVFLRLSIFGIFTTLVFDLLLDNTNFISITVKIIFLLSAIICYSLRNIRFNISTMIFVCTIMILSVVQSHFIPVGSTAILGVFMIVGFAISVMLTGRNLYVMHALAVIAFLAMMFEQIDDPTLRVGQTINDMVINYVGYFVVYYILSHCAYYLKNKYNTMYSNLKLANHIIKDKAKENQDKANEIEKQHFELIEMHSTLNEINNDLERIVNERTDKIRRQNKILITYSNMISHQLRAPIARLKGLINIYRVEKNPDVEFFIDKMENEANSIDVLLKETSKEISTNLDIEKDYN